MWIFNAMQCNHKESHENLDDEKCITQIIGLIMYSKQNYQKSLKNRRHF